MGKGWKRMRKEKVSAEKGLQGKQMKIVLFVKI